MHCQQTQFAIRRNAIKGKAIGSNAIRCNAMGHIAIKSNAMGCNTPLEATLLDAMPLDANSLDKTPILMQCHQTQCHQTQCHGMQHYWTTIHGRNISWQNIHFWTFKPLDFYLWIQPIFFPSILPFTALKLSWWFNLFWFLTTAESRSNFSSVAWWLMTWNKL